MRKMRKGVVDQNRKSFQCLFGGEPALFLWILSHSSDSLSKGILVPLRSESGWDLTRNWMSATSRIWVDLEPKILQIMTPNKK